MFIIGCIVEYMWVDLVRCETCLVQLVCVGGFEQMMLCLGAFEISFFVCLGGGI